MASETERARLRADVGATEASLPDDDADDIFTEAGEGYSGAAIVPATRVIAIRRLLASSAKLVTYQQNASMERQSDVFSHLRQLLQLWQGELAGQVAAGSTSGAARFGGLRQKPSRIKEYPG